MEHEKRLNFNIQDGTEFFSHEMSINFNPEQIFLDFKSVTPRVDVRSEREGPVICVKHNVVMVTPYHAKRIKELLGEMLDKYEKEFGIIEKSQAIKKVEKNMEKQKRNVKVKKDESSSYLG